MGARRQGRARRHHRADGRAFCAGGDIRLLYEQGKAGDHEAQLAFWREEYQLNRRIKRYPKPYVSLVDGIVMGGGVGLSAHGARVIASESFVFAMPEVGYRLLPRRRGDLAAAASSPSGGRLSRHDRREDRRRRRAGPGFGPSPRAERPAARLRRRAHRARRHRRYRRKVRRARAPRDARRRGGADRDLL